MGRAESLVALTSHVGNRALLDSSTSSDHAAHSSAARPALTQCSYINMITRPDDISGGIHMCVSA